MLIKSSEDLESFCNCFVVFWLVLIKGILCLNFYIDQYGYLQFLPFLELLILGIL